MDDNKVIWEYLYNLSENSNEEGCIKIVAKKDNLLSVLLSISKHQILYFNIKKKRGEVVIYDVNIIVPFEDNSTPDELISYLIRVIKPIIRDNKINRLNI